MTALIPMAAALVIGLFLGWLLTVCYATAALSRSQERMQRRVRYWQAETVHARDVADRLGRRVNAQDLWPGPTSMDEGR